MKNAEIVLSDFSNLGKLQEDELTYSRQFAELENDRTANQNATKYHIAY
jgi:hypothetical protein